MNGELETEGVTTSISDRKGGVCVTRVFRFGGGADEWVKAVSEECAARDGGEITLREMWLPDPAGGDEATLVVAASASGIILRNEPMRRTMHTPGGVEVQDIPGSGTSVEVSCETGLLGYIEGTIAYDGKKWNIRISGLAPETLVIDRGLLLERSSFDNIQDALNAVDRLVEDREKRESERRKERQRITEAASAQIDGLFGGTTQGPEAR